MGGAAPPGPISPLSWEQRVVRYAKTQAPANKIVLGLHLYGYDWPLQEEEEQVQAQSQEQAPGSWCWQDGCTQDLPPGPPTATEWMQLVLQFGGKPTPPPVAGPPTEADWLARLRKLAGATQPRSQIRGKALVWQQADALMKEHQATLQWWKADDRGVVAEPWFTYGDDTHAVTFANAESVMMRVNLARDEGLRGVFFWRLGGEDPAIWQQLPRRYYQLYKR